jgi:TetR/AcrR family transcriptional repressor of nem operon
MSRTREFEADRVLDQAMHLFWRMGYDRVSIQDLEAATGLGRGSLYNAFGDKEDLFLAVIERYLSTKASLPFRHLAKHDVGEGIRMMLDAVLERMLDPACPRGCLITNTSLAFGTGSSRIDEKIASAIVDAEAALERAITRARQAGQIPATARPKELARFYCAVVQSLGVMHKALGSPSVLRDIVTAAMRSWPGGSASADAQVSGRQQLRDRI